MLEVENHQRKSFAEEHSAVERDVYLNGMEDDKSVDFMLSWKAQTGSEAFETFDLSILDHQVPLGVILYAARCDRPELLDTCIRQTGQSTILDNAINSPARVECTREQKQGLPCRTGPVSRC